jgi:hypothetical protein
MKEGHLRIVTTAAVRPSSRKGALFTARCKLVVVSDTRYQDYIGHCSCLRSNVELNRGMRCSNRGKFLLLAGCAVWLAVLGWIDRATGYELGLFAFYTAPVGVVAWNLGQRPGIIVAFIASIIWYVADRYAGDRYSTPFYGYWNTGMHFITFIINAVTFAKIKSSLDRRHELERALTESREQLQQLTGTAPVCPQCRKPYVPERTRADEQERQAATSPGQPPAEPGSA